MLESVVNSPASPQVSIRGVGAHEEPSALHSIKSTEHNQALSNLFPKGDEIAIGEGSRVVRDTMKRLEMGLPAGGFDSVPDEIAAMPTTMAPIMTHIVALMDSSSGDRLREIALDAQEDLAKLAMGETLEDPPSLLPEVSVDADVQRRIKRERREAYENIQESVQEDRSDHSGPERAFGT